MKSIFGSDELIIDNFFADITEAAEQIKEKLEAEETEKAKESPKTK